MRPTDEIFIAIAESQAEREACFAIRQEVFLDEQQTPVEEEWDGLDDAAMHFLALQSGKPVAVTRVRFEDKGATAKIERVAVRKAARGTGIGRQLLEYIHTYPDVSHVAEFVLSAQTHALPFYEKLGYKAEGDVYMEAGIPHKFMRKANQPVKQAKAV